MCGIAGILKIHGPAGGPPPPPLEAIPEAWLDVLDDAIAHRGPDGQGRFRDRAVRADGVVVDVAFVHRRLSIIDHAGGHQPMVYDGQRLRADLTYARGEPPKLAHELCPTSERPGLIAVVFNGCIYNHRELRTELESLGHRFETDHSDTEALAHGWRAWETGAFDACEAMLACAVWDRSLGTWALARDRFGEKPLYVLDDDGVPAAFASSAAGLVRLPETLAGGAGLRPDDLVEWIALGYAPERTPFGGLTQLAPGSWADSNGRRERRRASDLDGRTGVRRAAAAFVPIDRGERAAADAVEAAIDDAVRRRLEADVPLACFLSGGLDSSLIARAAARHVDRLRTICVRMPDERYDESAHARRVAELIGSEHEEIETGAAPADDLLALIAGMGLPFGDSSLLPTHWVSRAAHERVGVAMGGDGGDELFLGYERYAVAGDLVPIQLVTRASFGISPSLTPQRDPKSAWTKGARLMTAAGRRSYRSLLAIFQAPDLRALLGPRGRACRWDDRANSVRLAQRYDLDHHLPGDLLRKVDTASMACPLEVRSPMLDPALARLTLTMGLDRLRSGRGGLVVSHAQRKGLLRSVARRHFPRGLVDRPKQGFAIPIGAWFRTDFGGMRQLLHDHLGSADPFPGLADAGVEIDMGFVRRMLREHDAAGERSLSPWRGRDHSQRLYMLLVLSVWARWLARVRANAG